MEVVQGLEVPGQGTYLADVPGCLGLAPLLQQATLVGTSVQPWRGRWRMARWGE
jgi:hypothetical protein